MGRRMGDKWPQIEGKCHAKALICLVFRRFRRWNSAPAFAPADLGELERKAFLDIVLACKPSHFQPSDLPLLAAYCRAIVLERQASNALAVAGHVTEDGRVSPWMKVWEQANKAMLSLAHRLRLSPQGVVRTFRPGPPRRLRTTIECD